MRILVTGADGFVGSWMVPHLVDEGHSVVAAIRPGDSSIEVQERRAYLAGAERIVELELSNVQSIDAVMQEAFDGVVHIGAVSSVTMAASDAWMTWMVNTMGSALVAEHLGRRGALGESPVFLFVSTAEVYGQGPPSPRRESDPTHPISRYAASKLAAEAAVLEVGRRTGMRVVIARAFPHTGPRQARSFALPAFAHRILLAKSVGAPAVAVGNLELVRDFLHVSDAVAAYRLLLEHGQPGHIYNVASGNQTTLRELFNRLADIAEYRVVAETDAELVRALDILYLVGDSSKLQRATGWKPTISLDRTLTEVMNAQAH